MGEVGLKGRLGGDLGACIVSWRSWKVIEQGTKYDMIPNEEDSGCLYTQHILCLGAGDWGRATRQKGAGLAT